jgi:MSHA biogenesis protein MshE
MIDEAVRPRRCAVLARASKGQPVKLDDRNELAALMQAAQRPSAAGARPKLRLGDMLVAQGVITSAQLTGALAEQKRSGRRLGRVLIEDLAVSEENIAQALSQQLRLAYVELTLDMVSARIVKLLPEAAARRFRVLPIDETGNLIRLGMADPTDYQALDDVQRLMGRELDPVVVTETRLNAVLDRLYSKSDEISGLAKELELEIGAPSLDAGGAATTSADDAPVAKLLQTLFEDALRSRASDIHVEPQERKLQIRFRIDGALTIHTEAESRIAPAVVQRLKLMSGLDIAERRLPQDGRFVARVRNQAIDMRISTMPTQYGESVVLRLLPQQGGLLALEKLGMPAGVLARVREAISQAQGMLLVTGPTGSGKTTTLYGALAELNAPEAKIITVEDPVEYRLPGINQVQVNEKIGLSFATVLRSTLRQDPDIVLVGEMRDRDTVETGLRAAMTGHMVLSTLHTNDAASTPLRLLDMGAARYLVATSLRLVLAQRLVRTVCPECGQPHAPTAQEKAFLSAMLGTATPIDGLRQGAGCGNCNGTGYLGRHGVYELLDMTPEVVAALVAEDTQRYVNAARASIGPHSLGRHACELVLAGISTAREAMRVVGRAVEG